MAAVTMTTIAIGAAIGAGVGAVATYASGGRGDAIWKGALTGAVGGALTAGVGSWATSAGGLALGNVAGYALGGAVGGIGAGALGTALNGGNSSDYLRNITTGGVLGGATGALGGYLAPGAEAGVNPVTGGGEGGFQFDAATGEMIPADSAIASSTNVGGTAAPSVEASVTGPTVAPTQTATTTPLADTVSTVSQPNTTTGFDLNAVAQQGRQQSTTSLQNLGLDSGVVQAEGSTPFPTSTPAPEQSTGGDWWKGYTSGLKTTTPTTTGTGTKMTSDAGLANYLKLMGYSQLVGGGVKTLGALATAPETSRNRQQLMDLYNQQNAANQYYQNLMQQSYQNPMGYLGSGEAAATRSAALQKALAINAAAGRRTQGGALNNALMMSQLQNLQNYRRGIPTPQYGAAAQTLNYAQQYSPTADIFGGLASGVTPLSLYSLFG